MWKVAGKKIFPKWHKVRQAAAKCKSAKTQSGKPSALCVVVNKHSQSSGDNDWRQHARQKQWFRDDPQFQSNAFCNSLLETIGLVGTAAFCIDLQHRYCKIICHNGSKSSCAFSRLAFAMPKSKLEAPSPNSQSEAGSVINSTETIADEAKTTSEEITEKLQNMTLNSVAAIENSIGVLFLQQDEKEAFEFFKSSAQLGCPKGLFNLGLCYETGRGTKVNLLKAAKCYEEAAAKGHNFAIYNLAVYTLKGLGGISEDIQKGLQLLTEAAEKGVPEAQVSLGLYYLEQEKYKDAYQMFRFSADASVDGKYYLGLCYENGWGTPQNSIIATEMYAHAARKGHEEATLKLGSCYETGNAGMDPDTEFSMTLYRMLAEKGHKGGKQAMQSLKEKQDSKWNLRDVRHEALQSSSKITSKNPVGLHTSSSFPELRKATELRSNCKIEHSKSMLHSMISLHDPYISSQRQKSTDQDSSKDVKYSLDLAIRGSLVFQLSVPQALVANS